MPLNVNMISSGKQILFILQSHLGVSHSLCEHLRAFEQCFYFC